MRPRNGQDGYAVLLVFAMAATVAISLYLELPRAAFEAQRDKEQILIDRGEAYSRGVQLFVRKFNRFPADFDALNSTQGMRFLRRQYADPMTGKDEWRVVHVGPGGVFTDSLVYGTKKKDDKNAPQTFITEMQQVGGNTPTGTGDGVNLANRRRASDTPGAPGDPTFPPQSGSGDPSQPGPVQVLPDDRIVPAILGSQSGGAPGGTALPGQPGFGSQPVTGSAANSNFPNQGISNPAFPNQGFPNQQGFPGQTNTGQQPFPGQGVPGQPNAPPAAAANLINQLLTTPRPGGFPGQPSGAVDQFGNPLPQSGNGQLNGGFNAAGVGNGQGTAQAGLGTPVQAGATGQVIGGGIAGVASKRDQEGIKVYNGRTDYKEWEFVYDVSKDKSRGGNGATPGTQNVQGQQQNNQQPNTAQPGSAPAPGTTPPPIPPH